MDVYMTWMDLSVLLPVWTYMTPKNRGRDLDYIEGA